MIEPLIRRRPAGTDDVNWPASMPRLLQRLYAARGVRDPGQVDHRLARLMRPDGLGGLERAAGLLQEAIAQQRSILVVGDYDCDGATGCAVAVRGLRMLGAQQVDFAVPDRRLHGYGLSPSLLDSLPVMPDMVVTVDNGIAAHSGVAEARRRGARVIITDHHLPAATLPEADAIVNPNLPGDGFASKALAGVGVMFYLLLALRARLDSKADLASLLDLVALGTVADMVPLDDNNRILVAAGLQRMRNGRACTGVRALAEAASRSMDTLSSADIGFALAPRLNAAGRLENMRLGIECLLSDDPAAATSMAQHLSAINQERRELQADMLAEAEKIVDTLADSSGDGVVVYQPHWHPGVVGLVASRLKERLHRPVVAFAPAGNGDGTLRGSARSIAGVHVRDVLVAVAARSPGLIPRFGGHAMAAGLELAQADLDLFAEHFDAVIGELIDDDVRQAVLWTDGELPAADISMQSAQAVRSAGPWGQAFPLPLFDNVFVCEQQRSMGQGGRHRRLRLRDPRSNHVHEGVMFNTGSDLPMQTPLRVVYELTVNEWNGRQSLQLLLRHVAEAV
ncbi:MAG: single-stranded-DNA-specific exonuclease RecJ [Rhodanobacteraceae bacterium]